MTVLFTLKGKAWQVFDTWQFMVQKYGGDTKLGQIPETKNIRVAPVTNIPIANTTEYFQSLN